MPDDDELQSQIELKKLHSKMYAASDINELKSLESRWKLAFYDGSRNE